MTCLPTVLKQRVDTRHLPLDSFHLPALTMPAKSQLRWIRRMQCTQRNTVAVLSDSTMGLGAGTRFLGYNRLGLALSSSYSLSLCLRRRKNLRTQWFKLGQVLIADVFVIAESYCALLILKTVVRKKLACSLSCFVAKILVPCVTNSIQRYQNWIENCEKWHT